MSYTKEGTKCLNEIVSTPQNATGEQRHILRSMLQFWTLKELMVSCELRKGLRFVILKIGVGDWWIVRVILASLVVPKD